MLKLLKTIFIVFNSCWVKIYTYFVCLWYGLKYDSSWTFIGFPVIHRPFIIHNERKNAILLGKNLKLISSFESNAIGLLQPVFLNARSKYSKIIIGDNVGISGSTLSSMKLIKIGNNVKIGSGCLITDNDAHNVELNLRNLPLVEKSIAPVVIGNDVFIGARSIILKGVIIGDGSVIGAGSVVVKHVLPNSLVAGNPAVFVKNLNS